MQVLQSLAELLDEEPCCVAGYGLAASVAHVLLEGDAADVLLDQDDVLGGFEVVIELADVGVLHLLHALDFSLDRLLFVLIVQLEFRIDFDRHSLLRLFVLGQFYDGVGSFAQDAYDLVFAQLFVGEGLHFLLGQGRCLRWLQPDPFIFLGFGSSGILHICVTEVNSIVFELIKWHSTRCVLKLQRFRR